MPPIRGRFYAEIEGTGRARRFLDVLLWFGTHGARDYRRLDLLEALRNYLEKLDPFQCQIRLHVPQPHGQTARNFETMRLGFTIVGVAQPGQDIHAQLGADAPADLADAVATAHACDADLLVTTEVQWFPFIQEVYGLQVLLADTRVLLRQAELFVRGHDVPWAFENPILCVTWTGFYQLSEGDTFNIPTEFLSAAQRKGANPEALETARTLIHNRLPNLCFTRDRLLFYDLQQNAAQRAGWKRQDFSFEAAYYLNFYYLLLYGGFDHIAIVVNHLLGLGLAERLVGFSYKDFRTALEQKSPKVAALFTDAGTNDFVKRIGALRHFAAHRGSIMPTKLVERPDVEPTVGDIDDEIAKQGLDQVLVLFPAGAARDQFREVLRFNMKMAMYERGKVIDGVVQVQIDGQHYYMRPMNDTEWNFAKFHSFLVRVLSECAALL